MRGIVIYESMYGNTHRIADAIAKGMDLPGGVLVVPAAHVDQSLLDDADIVVVGGPTHAHGMSRDITRTAAMNAATKPGSSLHTDRGGAQVGLRDWFATFGTVRVMAVAFDTRAKAPLAFTGRAAKGIAKMLRRHGMKLIAAPQSFLVDKDNRLLPGELGRALVWGEILAQTLATSGAQGSHR